MCDAAGFRGSVVALRAVTARRNRRTPVTARATIAGPDEPSAVAVHVRDGPFRTDGGRGVGLHIERRPDADHVPSQAFCIAVVSASRMAVAGSPDREASIALCRAFDLDVSCRWSEAMMFW